MKICRKYKKQKKAEKLPDRDMLEDRADADGNIPVVEEYSKNLKTIP